MEIYFKPKAGLLIYSYNSFRGSFSCRAYVYQHIFHLWSSKSFDEKLIEFHISQFFHNWKSPFVFLSYWNIFLLPYFMFAYFFVSFSIEDVFYPPYVPSRCWSAVIFDFLIKIIQLRLLRSCQVLCKINESLYQRPFDMLSSSQRFNEVTMGLSIQPEHYSCCNIPCRV